jgi:hypothetical protein
MEYLNRVALKEKGINLLLVFSHFFVTLILILEIAIAARSRAHRLGAVLVRSLVKVRSSPIAESRLFARRFYVD